MSTTKAAPMPAPAVQGRPPLVAALVAPPRDTGDAESEEDGEAPDGKMEALAIGLHEPELAGIFEPSGLFEACAVRLTVIVAVGVRHLD